MTIQLEQNKFYSTFTPFINEKTKTAEKTIKGRKAKKEYVPPYKFGREFYSYMTAGGLLALPILAMAISQKNILAAAQRVEKELYRNSLDANAGIFSKASRKIAETKQSFLTKFWNFIEPLKKKRESLSSRLRSKESKSVIGSIYNGINDIFKNLKTNAANRKYKRVTDSFATLEKTFERSLQIFDDSAKGNIKILFPKRMLKEGLENYPRVIDISKTADGKNRAEEIRKIIQKIKNLLVCNKIGYEDIVQKITFSCEDIFVKGESKLMNLFLGINKKGINTQETTKLISTIQEYFVKYRFAEKSDFMEPIPAAIRRKAYLQKIKGSLSELRRIIPEKFTDIRSKINSIETLVTERAKPENMGLVEQLRSLIKCDDITLPILQKGKYVSLYKLLSPKDYFNLKQELTEFAKGLKFAHKVQKHLLPNDIFEIDRGGIFTKAIALGAPATLLGANIYNSKAGEEKAKSKRNFYSFLVGSAVMGLSNYCTMNSQSRSIIYGILSAFITSRLAERYIKE